MSLSNWARAQRIERQFWDSEYAAAQVDDQRWRLGVLGISFGFRAKSVIDLGGGPQSILLQISREDVEQGTVIDPLPLTFAESSRYRAAHVNYIQSKAEDAHTLYDCGIVAEEVWLYNVLQHVDSVPNTLATAMTLATKTIRIVEWLHEPIEPHHLHSLSEADLRLTDPWVIRQEVYGTIITADYEKHFLATVWRCAI